MTGPEWSREVAKDYLDYLRNGVLKSLKTVLSALERMPEEK